MNKILTVMFTSLLLIAGNAQAHCGKCGVGDAPKMDIDAMAGEKADHLTKELKLTDEQKTKVQAVIKEKLAKKQEIQDQEKKAMDALHEEFKTKLSGILDAEQMKSWEETKKNTDNMHGKCPMCKEGKMCKMCKLKKNKMGAENKDKHDHGDKK